MLNVSRLTPAIGAIVEGIDLAASPSDAAITAIKNALVEHHVIFFRDQELTPTQHRDFAARFGKLHIHPIYPKHPEAPEIIVLDNGCRRPHRQCHLAYGCHIHGNSAVGGRVGSTRAAGARWRYALVE